MSAHYLMKSSHVAVHRAEPEDYYYLDTRQEALIRLADHHEESMVMTCFDLHETDAIDTRDAFDEAEEAPDRTVVLDDGRVAGFSGWQPSGRSGVGPHRGGRRRGCWAGATPQPRTNCRYAGGQPPAGPFPADPGGPQRGNPTFTIRLTAADPNLGLYLKPFGPVELQMDPLKFFDDFFLGIENLPLKTPEERQIAELRLAAKGLRLFSSLFPDDVKVLLWELKDRITTVEVESEDPWIPWELCKLEGKENGQFVEGHLCVRPTPLPAGYPGSAKSPR